MSRDALKHRLVLSACFLALPALGRAQGTRLEQVAPVKVRAIEKALEREILPPEESGVFVDRTQVFSLVSPDFKPMVILPLVFQMAHGEGGGSLRNCGVYFVPEGGTATFAVTIGAEISAVSQCDGLEAMSVMANEGSRPRIILLYSVSSPSVHLRYPAVLEFHEKQGYVLDEADTDDLGGSTGDRLTIASIKDRIGKVHGRR